MAGGTVSRTPHFALHRLLLPEKTVAKALIDAPQQGPDVSSPRNDQVLFVVPGVWLGAMVPKRWAKRAVTRNTIKRLVYSLAAEYEPRLMTAAHVVRLRAAFDRKQFVSASSDVLKEAVRRELRQLFHKACVNNVALAAAAPPESSTC